MIEHASYPVFDGHNDTLLDLHLPQRSGRQKGFLERSEAGHIDLPRAIDGGFGGGFFAIFAPSQKMPNDFSQFVTPEGYSKPLPEAIELGYAQEMTLAMAANMYRIEAAAQGRVRVVRHVNEIQDCLDRGVLAMVLHFEGAEAIDADLNALEVFYQAGLRSIGLVWSRPNIFCRRCATAVSRFTRYGTRFDRRRESIGSGL